MAGMPYITVASQKRGPRKKSVLALVFGACIAFTFGIFACFSAPAYMAYWSYTPEEGDILFQSLPHSRLVNAIEGVTESPYSHCGIVAKLHDQWVVYEAYRKVEVTPLKEFIFRGRHQGFAVYRFNADHRKHISGTIDKVQKYLGRPYDVRYRMDDEQIYCSELIFKAYRESSGEQLGTLVRMGDLNWRPFQETIKHFEQGPVPLDREMITPKDLAAAGQLDLAFSYGIAVKDRK